MQYIYISIALLIISFIANRKKTISGFKKGLLQFARLLPALLSVVIIISIILYFLPNEIILSYLGESAGWEAYVSAAIIGSIALIPGFIAFPLAGILVNTGVSYSVIAVFITTLLMVGILTLPIEMKFFDRKTALLRNGLSFAGALVVGFIMVLLYSFL
ncbi:MAG: hypothetical protein ACOC12_00770 [Bacteroidota bacterium]